MSQQLSNTKPEQDDFVLLKHHGEKKGNRKYKRITSSIITLSISTIKMEWKKMGKMYI